MNLKEQQSGYTATPTVRGPPNKGLSRASSTNTLAEDIEDGQPSQSLSDTNSSVVSPEEGVSKK